MKLLINGKSRKIMYNETDKYYYKCKDGKVDANQYFLKGDKVGSLTEGSLKKQCRKMLVGGVAPLSPVKEEPDDEINKAFITSFDNNNNIHNALGFLIQYNKTRNSVIKQNEQNEALTTLLNNLITIDEYNSYSFYEKTKYNEDLKSQICEQKNSKKTEGGKSPKKKPKKPF
jgi:ERCC4-type nuclease